jgi:hypothetical protein
MKTLLLTLLPLVTATALAAPDAPAETEALTPGQMAAARQVLVGEADCDMKQRVSLRAIEGRPGFFELLYLKSRYVLAPEETRTGAVRLEDRKAGIVWLQIPSKSMLLDTAKGSRVVDGCTHPDQRPLVLDALDARALLAQTGFGLASLGR